MKNIKILSKFNSLFLWIFIFSLTYIIIISLKENFDLNLSSKYYLTWHNIIEILCMAFGFSIASVTFYTYKQTHVYSVLFIGQIFLFVSIMDFFHAMSFKGMPLFFIQYVDYNRTITFWIISRLIMSSGILVIMFMIPKPNIHINENILTTITLLFSVVIAYLVMYNIDIFPKMFNHGNPTRTKIYLEYLIIFLFFLTTIKISLSNPIFKKNSIFYLKIAILLLIFSEYSFIRFTNLYDFNNFLGHVYKIAAYIIFFKELFITSFNQPYNKLKEYIKNQDKTIEEKTNKLRQSNEIFLKDLNNAKNIQNSIFPDEFKTIYSTKFYSKYIPVEKLSGDYFNYYPIDDKNIIFFISDVSGHGVSAAMLTIFINQCIKSSIENLKTNLCPSKILNYLYKEYNLTNFDPEVYILLLMFIYNHETKKLYFSSAGLNTEPIYISNNEKLKKILGNGFPICKLLDIYKPEYIDNVIDIQQNDKLLIYTDGLSDISNKSGDIYSDNYLYNIIKDNNLSNGEKIFNNITSNINIMIGNKKLLKDDIAYILVEF
jgi:phosphoserine phosphatase RsbU/P